MTTQQDEMRAKFEAAVLAENPDEYLKRGRNKEYIGPELQPMWWAWQAATAAHSEALAAVTSEREVLRRLVRAVEMEMSDDWLCNSYHPSLAPALKAARATLTPPTHPAAAPGDKEE